MFLPAQRHTTPLAPGLDAATRQGKRGGRRERRLADYGPLVAVGAIAIGVLLLVTLVTGQSLSFGPLLLAGAGVAVLWWQADEAQRQRWIDPSRRMNPVRAIVGGGGWRAWLRIAAGLMLLIAAIVLFSLRSGSLRVALNVGLAAAFGILGLGFMVGPWLLRLSSDLSEEREARVRSEERADVAAHLHDSVLQTLALIQRSAGDPATVTRLARAQERDLRSWLFDSLGEGPGHPGRGAARGRRGGRGRARRARRGGLRRRRARDRGGPPDRAGGPRGDDQRRQALRRRHRGRLRRGHRRRGRGVRPRPGRSASTPTLVAEDRQGVRGSIVGRMERHGGSAACAASPARAPRSGSRCPPGPPTPGVSHMSPAHRRHRRRPRHVPRRRALRSSAARSTSSPRRPTSTRRSRAVHPAPARGGAARRAPARRWRRRGDAAYDGQGERHPVPRPVASPTPPRT